MAYEYDPEPKRGGGIALAASPIVVDSFDGVLCTVALAYAGTITRKLLKYNAIEKSIPVANIPLDQRGIVSIFGRNDTPSAQRMGISWVIRDPAGRVVESYAAWELWPYTGAGGEHKFIGDRFDLNKTGAWRIKVDLLMGA